MKEILTIVNTLADQNHLAMKWKTFTRSIILPIETILYTGTEANRIHRNIFYELFNITVLYGACTSFFGMLVLAFIKIIS